MLAYCAESPVHKCKHTALPTLVVGVGLCVLIEQMSDAACVVAGCYSVCVIPNTPG